MCFFCLILEASEIKNNTKIAKVKYIEEDKKTLENNQEEDRNFFKREHNS